MAMPRQDGLGISDVEMHPDFLRRSQAPPEWWGTRSRGAMTTTPRVAYVTTGERVSEVLPLHPYIQPDDWEGPEPAVPVNLPTGEMVWSYGTGTWCQIMHWVAYNPLLASGLVVAGWWVLRRRR